MLSDSSAVRTLLAPWAYDPDAVETYGRALTAAMRHPGARSVLEHVTEAYERGAEIEVRTILDKMDLFSAECGESPYTMRMLPYLCLLEPARSKYAAAGLDEQIYLDSFADLLWKTRECHRLHGVWGSFVAAWFYRFFALRCFALGRLQFELAKFSANALLDRGTQVINVHIPSSGRLSPVACEASYAQAVLFFGFEHEKQVPFVCDSWLLHPLCAGLPDDSGIRRFASDYKLLHTIDDPDRADMWIIFGKAWNGPPEALPEETILQRVFKRQLCAGGPVGRGYGLYLREP